MWGMAHKAMPVPFLSLGIVVHVCCIDVGETIPIKPQQYPISLLTKCLVKMSAAITSVLQSFSDTSWPRIRSWIQATLTQCVFLQCRSVGALPVVIIRAVAWLSWYISSCSGRLSNFSHSMSAGSPLVRSAWSAATISASTVL